MPGGGDNPASFMTVHPDSSTPTPSAWWLRALARLPVPLFRAAGWVMAAALLLLAPSRRRVVLRNLALCFPQATARARRRWAWQTFLHFSQSFLDRVWLWQGTPDRVRQRVQVSDPHGVLQHDGPLLFFAPHFYGMDAGWAKLTLDVRRRWWTFYAPQRPAALDRWVKAGRQRFGRPRLVSRREGLRPLLRGLQEGASLCLLPDMDHGARNSVFVSFFGVQTATVTSLPRLAAAAGVPVASLVCRMVPGGYRVEIGPLWDAYPQGDDAADALRMNQELERYIRSMPGQYHWLHRRFKTRPPGAAPAYAD
jgi:KDO2-lipid IV(A) lauroyltransferase